ncbi:hypothetical protein KC19_8G088100 [Ceratodon purpureus]|uniref:Uncharacterized protein n=1 Tax=Ceratodon purpureus TaxID=3225 RepID=A0A8T0H024_CERPU|nr:hypothetical protein KC19_8G088100 [Ceratodon purpureus]
MGAVISSEADVVDELHQVPEAAPCHPSSSPLSPQLSLTRGTSYLGPLIRVSDPYNILSPSSSSPGRVQSSSRLQSRNNTASAQRSSGFSGAMAEQDVFTEIHFIRHAESTMNVKSELIGGRTPSATLSGLGKRQALALGAHLRSIGMDFDAIYSSPLERAKQTAYAILQELDIPRDAVELTEAVVEASQGQWEGKNRSEIYTPARILLMNSTQPDFRAPGGESQREVEFRMMEFLNNVVLPRASSKARRQKGSREHLNKIQPTPTQVHALKDMDASQVKDCEAETSDLTSDYQPRSNLGQIPDSMSSTNLSGSAPEEILHHDTVSSVPYRVAVISHGLAIKCMLGGLTGSNPHFTRRWCIDNTSVTVVRHSTRKGWEIQRINDTSHLLLL